MGHLLNMAIKMQDPDVTTTTTTTTAATITVSWFYDSGGCATASYAFKKNGVTQSSGGGGTSASGSFTCIVGDILVAEYTSGAKGFACNTAFTEILRNGATIVATDTQFGFNVLATSTWTVTSGTTSVNMTAAGAV
jgi:hypothetical protein